MTTTWLRDAKSRGGRFGHTGRCCPFCGEKFLLPLRAYDVIAVLRTAPDGLTYPQIAARLGISVTKVRDHVGRIRAELGNNAIISMGKHGVVTLGKGVDR